MGQERRKHPRLTVPIDGQWRNASTGSFCQVLNLSLGGCFAKSPSTPATTDTSTMTIYFGKHGPMSIKGKVVHGAPKAGFGFEFQHMDREVRIQLGQNLDSLKTGNY
jgi:hypothetical protein